MPNDFTYDDDPEGTRCPLGAHIRVINPRVADPAERTVIARRGQGYGVRRDDPEDGDHREQAERRGRACCSWRSSQGSSISSSRCNAPPTATTAVRSTPSWDNGATAASSRAARPVDRLGRPVRAARARVRRPGRHAARRRVLLPPLARVPAGSRRISVIRLTFEPFEVPPATGTIAPSRQLTSALECELSHGWPPTLSSTRTRPVAAATG